MKILLLPTLVLISALPVVAADPAPDKSAAPEAAPAPAEPPSSPEAQKAWDKLAADFKAMPKIGEEGPSPEAKKSITTLYGETHDFYTKFPDDPHMISATMLWAQLGSAMIRFKLDGAPTLKDIDTTLDLLTTNPKLPPEKRAEIRVVMIAKSMREAMQTPEDKTQWDTIDAKIDAFEKDYGDDYKLGNQPVIPMLRQQQLQVLETLDDKTRYTALLQKLSSSKNEQLSAMAREIQDKEKKQAELKTKPIDIKFTSVDGKAIDLAKMRGKVVLVDFWATWCPPCRAEVPDVVAAYKKYHDKGFEVVGISLDQDKDKLTAYTKENKMTWPQYFDGKGWQNDISSGFGIDSIPAMWLLDKKGMLVSTDAREDLDGQIGKQLRRAVKNFLIAVIVLGLLAIIVGQVITSPRSDGHSGGGGGPDKPLDLKFTAVDGRQVDFAKLRGKVVLLDFWATWCPPCREEVPNVVAAYNKFHGQGFEIVGISLDKDKGSLLSFTQQNGMVWPQFYDGNGWSNEISTGFGIESIPAMWLVGRDGKVITTNARPDLAGQIERALAAK